MYFQAQRLTRSGKHKPTIFQQIVLGFVFTMPNLADKLGLSSFDPISLNFFIGIIKAQLKARNYQPSKRNDFIDIMLQQSMSVSEEDKRAFSNKEELERSVIASAFLLFFAGYETSSTVMASTCFFLSKNPDKLERLYREIRDAVENSETDDLDYKTLQGLPYLEMCIQEALRFFPVILLERVVTKPYQFRDSKISVAKGDIVQIPAPAIMKDERYFPNPEEFNPENFSEGAIRERGSYLNLGFGQGPRNCVGKRFALLAVKNALARVVYNFELLACSKTIDPPYVTDPLSQSGQPIGNFWIKVQERRQ